MANAKKAPAQESAFKTMVYPVIILVVICVVCSALLAVLNDITAPIIAANEAAKTQEAYLGVLPEGTDAAGLTTLEGLATEGVVGAVTAPDGAVAVPVRVLAEVMKMTTEYDAQTGLVHLTSSEEVGYLEDGDTYYDSDSLYWLSRIIYCESGNQVLDGKIAVGNVVLNRVSDSRFPDTIYDVIFQKNQFSPASSGSIYREPNEASVIAAKLVLDGAVVLEDALFFNRAGLVCYASKNRPYITTIGGHAFYA